MWSSWTLRRAPGSLGDIHDINQVINWSSVIVISEMRSRGRHMQRSCVIKRWRLKFECSICVHFISSTTPRLSACLCSNLIHCVYLLRSDTSYFVDTSLSWLTDGLDTLVRGCDCLSGLLGFWIVVVTIQNCLRWGEFSASGSEWEFYICRRCPKLN